jgi:hypothetical protein
LDNSKFNITCPGRGNQIAGPCLVLVAFNQVTCNQSSKRPGLSVIKHIDSLLQSDISNVTKYMKTIRTIKVFGAD